jgi:hypothetical protein
MDNLGLRREELALQSFQHGLSVRPGHSGIDRRIGRVEGVQQFVAEFRYEIGERDETRIGFGNGFGLARNGFAGDEGIVSINAYGIYLLEFLLYV